MDSAPVSKEAAKDGTEVGKKSLLVLITTDKGMCGSINSNINRFVRNMPSSKDCGLVVVGEKGVTSMERSFLNVNIPFSGKQINPNLNSCERGY